MEKSDIKLKLREGLESVMNSEEPLEERLSVDRDPSKDDETRGKNDLNKRQGEGGKKDYSDVRRAIEKTGGPSMVDVMKLTGIPDDKDATNRSLFRKKVKQIKNKETGSFYQFSDEELNQVRAALDIQN